MCASGVPHKHATTVTADLPAWVDEVVDWHKQYHTDEEKMLLAVELSKQNVLRGSGGPFGAAIFDRPSGRLVGVGVNRVMPCNNSALHAEVLAIMLSQSAEQQFTLGANGQERELFASCEPCAMCLGATLWSGVKRLVCGATGDDARAIGFDEGPVFEQSFDYLKEAGLEVVRQVCRTQANQVLQDYVKHGGEIYNG
ncbi:nucleoside deaminase [Aliiglaciecola sp. CAU 1673]|uniref:nucleoside deaminase n=1 Tax=Aliiglaciecola sp. CAU 1673 TaxID=3032595 RepID=UPI0023DC5096|nr:nucleoside deaminase [Aliiglaciecola sp. CAU 1673]MDF2177243.1 nucleoside deaminase [Aliiglaciecola sp. CAU 1673]